MGTGRACSASAHRVVCGNRPNRTLLRDGLSHSNSKGEMIDELDHPKSDIWDLALESIEAVEAD